MSERLEQQAKTIFDETFEDLYGEDYAIYKATLRKRVLKMLANADKRLVDAQQQLSEAGKIYDLMQEDSKKSAQIIREQNQRLQRIRDLMDQGRTFAELQEWVFQPKEYRSSPTCGAYDSVLTDNRLKIKWVSAFEVLAVVQGDGAAETEKREGEAEP